MTALVVAAAALVLAGLAALGVRRPAKAAGMTRRAATACAAALFATVAAGGSWGLPATPASAHAHLVRAVPGDGATVTTAPARVRLVFDENVRTPAAVVVTGPSGTRVDHGQVQVLDNTASVRVDVMTAGRYTVAFRVVSADGHPVSAQTSFRFAPGGSAQPGMAQSGTTARHAGHEAAAAGGGFSRGRVIGIVAGAGLLAGLALLTVRRLPGGLVNPAARPSGPAVTGTRSSTPALHADNDAAVSRPELWRWVAGVALVTVSVLVVVLLAGGGAPQPVPAGLPDSGPVTGWGLPSVRLLADLAGLATVGLLLAAGLLLLLAGGDAGRCPGPRGDAGRAGGRGVAAGRRGRGRADRLGHLRHPAGAGDRRDGAAQLPGADVAGPGAAGAGRAADRRRRPGAGRGLAPRRGARSGGCAGRDDAAGADRALRIVRKPRARGREPAGAPGRGGAVGRRAGGPGVGGRRCGGR